MDLADTRYNRQEVMPQIGPEGQKKLAEARVVSIGAGGVKSSLLYYLVAAGVGKIRIIDFDRVEMSNLNRQILYTCDDIGRNKALAASDRLRRLNDEIDIEAVDARVDDANITELTGGFDVSWRAATRSRAVCSSMITACVHERSWSTLVPSTTTGTSSRCCPAGPPVFSVPSLIFLKVMAEASQYWGSRQA